MKRYQFGLATVLRARRAQEGIAKSKLQKANLAAAAAEMAAQRSLTHYEQVNAMDAPDVLAHRDRAVLAARAVLETRQSLSASKAAVGAAVEEYLAAAQAVSLLERLDDRRREEHGLLAQREEAALSDELAASRHARARRGPTGKGGARA